MTEFISKIFKCSEKKYTLGDFIVLFFVSIIAIFAHGMALRSDNLYNFDTVVFSNESIGQGAEVGRYLITIINKLTHGLDLMYSQYYINILLSILFSIISACLIIKILDIKDKVLAIIVGGLFVTFPTFESINIHPYCSHWYSFSILLAVISTIFLTYKKKHFIEIIPIICLALSIGIYQAYITLSVSLIMLFMIRKIVEDEDKSFIKYISYLFSIVINLTISFILYYGLNLLVCVTNNLMVGYNRGNGGLSSVFYNFPVKFARIYGSVLQMGIEDYGALGVFNGSPSVKMCYLLSTILAFVIFIIIIIYKKIDISKKILLVILFIILPISFNFLELPLYDDVDSMMAISIVFVLITPVFFADILFKFSDNLMQKISLGLCTVCTIIGISTIVQHIYHTNINYQFMQNKVEQLHDNMCFILDTIRNTEGYNIELPIIFAGDPEYVDKYQYSPNRYKYFDRYRGNWILLQQNRFPIMQNYLRNVLGFDYKSSSFNEYPNMQLNDEYLDMPIFPNYGFVKVIDNIIVVKFPTAR